VDNTVAVALISGGGSVAVAITALLLNFRLFNSLERRIELIESDLKGFVNKLFELDNRLSRIEEKLGPPR
jgi:3-methyladenine DNA glycosylase/8-oxoguanine DNA glycosylase